MASRVDAPLWRETVKAGALRSGALIVATALFGGTAPVVNGALVESTGNNLVPAMYMMGACVIGALALIKTPETAGLSLRGRNTPGSKVAAEAA